MDLPSLPSLSFTETLMVVALAAYIAALVIITVKVKPIRLWKRSPESREVKSSVESTSKQAQISVGDNFCRKCNGEVEVLATFDFDAGKKKKICRNCGTETGA